MAILQKRRWCRDCEAYRRFTKDDSGKVGGCAAGVLIVCTLGIALPFMIVAEVARQCRPYRCTECGRRG